MSNIIPRLLGDQTQNKQKEQLWTSQRAVSNVPLPLTGRVPSGLYFGGFGSSVWHRELAWTTSQVSSSPPYLPDVIIMKVKLLYSFIPIAIYITTLHVPTPVLGGVGVLRWTKVNISCHGKRMGSYRQIIGSSKMSDGIKKHSERLFTQAGSRIGQKRFP